MPGCGLCLAGVGYDLQDLQVHRHNLAGTGGKKKRALLFPAEDDGNDEDFDGSNHSDNDCNQCEDVNL